MLTEDEDRRPTPHLAAPPLDRLGVAELRAYIDGLRAEIVRAEAEIRRKDNMRSAADAVFKLG